MRPAPRAADGGPTPARAEKGPRRVHVLNAESHGLDGERVQVAKRDTDVPAALLNEDVELTERRHDQPDRRTDGGRVGLIGLDHGGPAASGRGPGESSRWRPLVADQSPPRRRRPRPARRRWRARISPEPPVTSATRPSAPCVPIPRGELQLLRAVTADESGYATSCQAGVWTGTRSIACEAARVEVASDWAVRRDSPPSPAARCAGCAHGDRARAPRRGAPRCTGAWAREERRSSASSTMRRRTSRPRGC
jgi:hypothetical protein